LCRLESSNPRRLAGQEGWFTPARFVAAGDSYIIQTEPISKKECLPRPDTIRYTLKRKSKPAPPVIPGRIVDSPGRQ
jgi:hypothetical protein